MIVFINNEKGVLQDGDIIHIRENEKKGELPHALFFRLDEGELKPLEVGIRREHQKPILIHANHHGWDPDVIAASLGIQNHCLEVIESDDETLHQYRVGATLEN